MVNPWQHHRFGRSIYHQKESGSSWLFLVALLGGKIVFQSTRCIKSFFPYKDRINRSQQSRVIYRANCWDCNSFYIGKSKRRLHDRKTEHFKALAKNDNTSAIADHVKATGHNIKWDHFDILAKGKTDYHCKIKETFFIQELEPAFNVNVGSEKLMLY